MTPFAIELARSQSAIGSLCLIDPNTVHIKGRGQKTMSAGGDISTLMRQEVELAKTEIRQPATEASKGAGMLRGAAVAGQRR